MSEQKIDLILAVQKFQLENTPSNDEVAKNQLIEEIESFQVEGDIKKAETEKNKETVDDSLVEESE